MIEKFTSSLTNRVGNDGKNHGGNYCVLMLIMVAVVIKILIITLKM